MTIEYLRSFRFGGYALFDLAISFLGIYLLSPLLSKLFLKLGLIIPKKNWLYLTLPLGVLVHLLVGTITPMTKSVIDMNGGYGLKLLMVVLLILGLRGIKRR